MGAGLTALLVAAVGVIGTLVSPILAQRTAARTSGLAAARDREIRREEREEARRRITFEERRAEYTALNALARTCRNEINAVARHHKETMRTSEQDLTKARDAWLAYQDRYDTAQMVLPDDILALASGLNVLLARGYQQLRALSSTGEPKPESVVEYCDGTVLDHVTEMRRAMREDLGVGGPC
ncbi:hypothetical protein AB0J82_20745 [Asanoa sp. NPDC049518]|uniref:hypothetical protein n=1 Tax=unclassified Asanoa TaxID=2685164 RepID=UPI0034298C63